MDKIEERRLLRIKEVAELLSISGAKVYAMAASGELPSVRMGRAVRIPTAAVTALLQASTSVQV